MGFFEWLGIGGKPRDAPVEAKPEVPDVQDNVRDSGQMFMFGRAESGEHVDEKSSLQIATVYACVRLLAETVAGLPLHLYRYVGNDGKERASDHPLYKILYRLPNPEMTSFSFRECMMTHLLLWGNAYAQIVRDKDLHDLEKSVGEGDENASSLDMFSLELFENIAYIFCKHADPENVPDTVDEWLEQFSTFSIYQVLPEIIELWGLNVQTDVESKKTSQN